MKALFFYVEKQIKQEHFKQTNQTHVLCNGLVFEPNQNYYNAVCVTLFFPSSSTKAKILFLLWFPTNQ